MQLTLHTFLSLDGIMQAPGAPGEDDDGKFQHGGWSFPYRDEQGAQTIAGWFAHAGAFLLGRRTYEIFNSFWPKVTGPSNPIASKLNALPKYVASTTVGQLAWANSHLLGPDVPAAVAELKDKPGGELQVHGSGGLAQTLIDHDLVDEYRLLFYPVHLGTGKKLFRDSTRPAALSLVDVTTTTSGVVIATYRPDGPVRVGSYV
jgi:dihydrofolate reductase